MFLFLFLSPRVYVAHKALINFLYFSLLAAAILTSSHDLHPVSFLSFSTVRHHVVLGLPVFRFPSGAQIIATLGDIISVCLHVECDLSSSISFSFLRYLNACHLLFLIALLWTYDPPIALAISSADICFGKY